MFVSPYRMVFSVPSWQAFTTNFFGPSGVRWSLLHFILGLLIAIVRLLFGAKKLPVCLKKEWKIYAQRRY